MSAAPLKILLLALGGEGGGTLTDWLVQAALDAGYPVQATSIPGVAQRTGATSYYLELLPVPQRELDGRQPVFCLAPLAGDLDLIVSSELLETARAVERGLPDADRTLLVTSTSRFLTVAEKMQPGDGRIDTARALDAAREAARETVAFDMQAAAREAGTVVSAVMFGAIAGTGLLPFGRAACEAALGTGGERAQASLRGFARGFEAAAAQRAVARRPAPGAAAQPVGPAAPPAGQRAAVLGVELPTAVAEIAALGAERLIDHQDRARAIEYLERVRAFADAECAALARAPDAARDVPIGPSAPAPPSASRAAARFLALWMAYEDIVRVADLKTRPERFARIRNEVRAQPHEPVLVRDFMKPGVDEIADVLPAPLAVRLRGWAARSGRRTLSEGVRWRTNSVAGLAAMRLVAALRPLRRRSSRYAAEQALIARWSDALLAAMPRSLRLAAEIAECPRLIKGYSDTHARGRANFLRILESLIEQPQAADAEAQAEAIRRAREAALADPEGRELAAALGAPAPPPREQPIRFVPLRRERVP